MTLSHSGPACVIKFEFSDHYFCLSNAASAKKIANALSADDNFFIQINDKKISLSTTNKTEAIFHNIVISRTIITTTGNNSTQINLAQHSVPHLSVIQIQELFNLAWEPLSNESWSNYLAKFQPIQYYSLSRN